MKVTIFSSNQPRHLNLALEFSRVADQVFFVSEVNTVFPGQIEDFFKTSEVMQTYFQKVINSERNIFGDIRFLPNNVRTLIVKSGDLNKLDKIQIIEALNSDIYVVFGSSYIKGWLIDFLVEQRAINIHMGLSPYYRGSSCNFWALYDNNPSYVGATIHLLSKGLDSGPILFHSMSKIKSNPFEYTMSTVKSAFHSIAERIDDKTIFNINPLLQNKTQEIRYSKNEHFTDNAIINFFKKKIDLFSKDFDASLLKDAYYFFF